MKNNDVLRRLRYIFDLSDNEMKEILFLSGCAVESEEIANLLKKEEDEDFQLCSDDVLSAYLDGFIIRERGQKDGAQPVIPSRLTNNLILRKLKIALNFRDENMLEIFNLAGFRLGKHELSAFFRKKGHKNYRECKDQVLRNFLSGLQIKCRGKRQEKDTFVWK